jgi:4-amino-4-deoxy-L-arabinose transferase-like glycosyltransferase
MTEALFTALIVCGMWLWRSNKIIASGIAFGFGMLTRPIVLPMLVLAVLVELLVRKSLRPILIILTLCLLVSAPWMIRNSLLEGEITLTQKSALGTNLLYGTFTREEFGTDIWTQALNRFKRCDNECAFEVAIERIKNGNWIRARLEQYPRLIIDTGTSLSPEFARGPTSLRVIYIFLQIIGIVLAIIGIKSQPIQVWLTPAFLLIFHLPLWIEARYFLPAIPFISIMTAVGMIRVYDRYSKGYILLLGK